jgi:hypothetical protein
MPDGSFLGFFLVNSREEFASALAYVINKLPVFGDIIEKR